MHPEPLRPPLEGIPRDEIDKEVNNSTCLKWDFSSGLGTLEEALATIKHLIRRERQFPERRNHRVQIQTREGKVSLWQLRSLLMEPGNGLVEWLLWHSGYQGFSEAQTLVLQMPLEE